MCVDIQLTARVRWIFSGTNIGQGQPHN